MTAGYTRPPFVTRHAVERVQEHHPNAGPRGVVSMLAAGLPVDAREVAGFLQRHFGACRDRYVLAYDRRGIYVLIDRPDEQVVVTYLRLSPWQVTRACEIWGGPA